MSEQAVIFFDIDGTLLDHDKKLPDSTKQAIAELKAAGHVVAIATGRAPFMYEELRQELEIDSFVSYNGSYVVVEGKVVFTNPLSKEDLLRLTEEGLSQNHPIVFMDDQDMRANVPNHEYIDESIESLKIGRFPSHDPNYHQGRELYQSLFFCAEGEEVYYQNKYPMFEFVRWHPVSVDILPKGGSKANGIKHAVQVLDIPQEHVYAFGDGLNDVEMLATIKNSVAMGNGEPEAKDAAKFVTKDVSEDGILHGLKMVGLL
ncbi:Cof-type HAD-IIB family hydrolase [Amphibacillus sediminis]|uniref:Cof-type HAD-IIB family hydrolase n=1 Tax=Amphibacillus sediminis TaxID=360185 RepID=UPI00083218FF|nr:Cof-type HAD-IIB family hydrolase [Amphibacillus sediminis]